MNLSMSNNSIPRAPWRTVLLAAALALPLLLVGIAPPARAALSEVPAAGVLDPTPDSPDGFGVDVAIDGDLAIVGAWQESTDAANANPKDKAGAAYIYQRNGSAWTLVQKLVPNDRHPQQRFGIAVAISGGHTALIGAGSGFTNGVQNAGAAYFFVKTQSGWQQAQKVSAPTPEVGANFGTALALDAAGDQAVIGAWREPASGPLKQSGAAYVYVRNSFTSWQLVQRLAPAYPEQLGHFGAAVALRGERIMIGAPDERIDPNTTISLANAGAVYYFENNHTPASSPWSQTQRLLAADRNAGDLFGKALAFNGNLLAVGSVTNQRDANGNPPLLSKAGAAYLFQHSGGTYTQTQKLTIAPPYRTAGDLFGTSVALDRAGQYLVVGASAERHAIDEVSSPIPYTGSAYVYQLTGGTATLAQKLVASDRSYHQVFGYRVAVTTANNPAAPEVLIGSYQWIVPANPPSPSIPSVGKVYFFR